jgi:hypothetical protein
VLIDDAVYLLFKQDSTSTTTSKACVQAAWGDIYVQTPGKHASTVADSGSLAKKQAQFLLSHMTMQAEASRFAVNNRVTFHPVDIFLIFATSFDREFFRGDAAAGTTSSVVAFAAGTVGAADMWIGKALHCVEGANKGEARVITDNDADSITVERAFTNAAGAGEEHQVRNTIYDVLPIGWGMGIDSNRIDVSAFEVLRETYLPGEEIDRFVLGVEGEFDIFKMLQEYILTPYGIALYPDTTTGKNTPCFMGQALANGVVDTYVSITDADIYDSGDIQHTFTNPVGMIKVEVRKTNYTGKIAMGFGEVESIYIRSAEIESAFTDDETETLEIKPLFDSERTVSPLLVRLYGLAMQYAIPPPVWTAPLDLSLWPQLHPGALVSITVANLVDSFAGARNWTTVIGRVLGMSLELKDKPVFSAQIELFFDTIAGGKIAPAATVTAKGNDANGDYFVVSTNAWTNNLAITTALSDADSWHFVTGDLIELRDVLGALKEAETIKGFGAAYTTGLANTTDGTRIYVVGAIASAIAAGDYVTFQPWQAGNTARMEGFAAYATAAGVLTGPDTAKEYA